MIKLDDNLLAMWVVEIRQGDLEGNWMASLSKRESGYELDYRFRWYVDDKAHDSEDKRDFFVARLNPAITEEKMAIEHGHEYYEFMKKHAGREVNSWELIRGARTTKEFAEVLKRMPGMHTKTLTEEEARARGL
jgi:hypothetical protein